MKRSPWRKNCIQILKMLTPLNYLESDVFLPQEAVRDELPEAEYSSLISKVVLSKKVSCLFESLSTRSDE